MKPPKIGLTILLLALALTLGACAVAPETKRTEWTPSPVTNPDGPVKHRVSDSHFHLVDFLQRGDGIERAVQAMDAAGVDHAMISGMPLVKKWTADDRRQPLYYLEDDSRAYWYSATDVLVARAVESLPEESRRRVHPFICGFNGTDMNAIEHIKRMIEWYPDLWQGIGEVMGRHDDLTGLTYGETGRADHPALDEVYAFAAANDMPVSVHSNIGSVWLREPIYLYEIESAVQRHPDTRFIWCHAGISRRIDIPGLTGHIRKLLKRYDNLWLDLSWNVFETYVAPDGKPSPEWVALVDEFPTRFMVGSDKVAKFGNLHAEIMKYYVFLDALKPETARRVARENFLSILPERVRAGLQLAPR